jgi:hypothetical protein
MYYAYIWHTNTHLGDDMVQVILTKFEITNNNFEIAISSNNMHIGFSLVRITSLLPPEVILIRQWI